MPQQARTEFTPGQLIADKYRIIRRIASGGMGVVYEAKNERAEQQHVAIKVIRSDQLNDKEAHARFRREARATAKLQSEHVARVYEVSSLQGGEPFIVMEYLRGKSLREQLSERGAIEPETAVEYTLQMLRGLADAHSHGIVHRDLKPSNVFISESADGEQVKLFDFGISKMAQDTSASSGSSNHLTASQAILGTPAYMAPEQVVSSRYVDGRADLWSLGTILYEMLTGTNPFESEAAGSSFAKILQLPIPEPRERNPDISASLSKVIMKCLERDPLARYQTTAELFDALLPFGPTLRDDRDELLRSLPEPQGAAAAKQSTAAELTWGRSSRRARAQRSMLLAAIPLLIGAVAVAWLLVGGSEMGASSAASTATSQQGAIDPQMTANPQTKESTTGGTPATTAGSTPGASGSADGAASTTAGSSSVAAPSGSAKPTSGGTSPSPKPFTTSAGAQPRTPPTGTNPTADSTASSIPVDQIDPDIRQ